MTYNCEYIEIVNTRCPHPETSIKMILLILQTKNEKDSVGGIYIVIFFKKK